MVAGNSARDRLFHRFGDALVRPVILRALTTLMRHRLRTQSQSLVKTTAASFADRNDRHICTLAVRNACTPYPTTLPLSGKLNQKETRAFGDLSWITDRW
jgi:hypothetical protein